MKNILMIAFLAGIVACGETKEIVEESVNETTEEVTEVAVDKAMVDGVVKTDTDCGFIIQVKMDDKIVKLEPLDLADEFKEDGLAIKLIYTPSRRPSKCLGMPIVIEKITK
jgi:hypothetical protein